jgi:hypothetical protein
VADSCYVLYRPLAPTLPCWCPGGEDELNRWHALCSGEVGSTSHAARLLRRTRRTTWDNRLNGRAGALFLSRWYRSSDIEDEDAGRFDRRGRPWGLLAAPDAARTEPYVRWPDRSLFSLSLYPHLLLLALSSSGTGGEDGDGSLDNVPNSDTSYCGVMQEQEPQSAQSLHTYVWLPSAFSHPSLSHLLFISQQAVARRRYRLAEAG